MIETEHLIEYLRNIKPEGIDLHGDYWGSDYMKQIVALIKKPQVTEEWIESKAIELNYLSIYSSGRNQRAFAIGRAKAEDFIRSLVKEIRGK